MAGSLVLISHLPEDLEFAGKVASRGAMKLHRAENRNDLRTVMTANPQAIVLWNAEQLTGYDNIAEILPKYCKARNLVAITSLPVNEYPDLLKCQVFNHHFLRSFDETAVEIAFRLTDAMKEQLNLSGFWSLKPYLPGNTAIKRIPLTQASHKWAAIEALQKYLVSQQVTGRLARLVANSVDELLLNAIFVAPVDPKGKRLRDPSQDPEKVEFIDGEQVSLELGATNDYMGLCITDRFGSLSRTAVVESLGKFYHRKATRKGDQADETSRGMGFRGIMESGLSLLFALDRNKATQVMLFFPRTESYREFRGKFRFISIFGE